MAAGVRGGAERRAASLPPVEAATKAAEEPAEPAAREGMYRCNDELDELLRLAKGYLRSGRLPGGPRHMRDFFDRFDAEAAGKPDIARDRPLEVDAPLEWVADPLPPPAKPIPEDLSGEALIARLQRDIKKIERSTAELKEEHHCVGQYLASKTVERCQGQRDLAEAEAQVQKAQRSIRETRDLFKRQEREIRELRAALAAPRPPLRAGEGAAAGAPPPSTQGRRAEADLHQHASGAVTDRPSTRGSSSRRPESTPARRPMTPRSPQQLKGALLPNEDQERPRTGPEAKVWSHLRSENEALASVIDAVGELSRQLQGGGGGGAEAGAGAGGALGGEAPHARATSPKSEPWSYVGLSTSIAPPKPKTYTSVLANKQKNYKAYL